MATAAAMRYRQRCDAMPCLRLDVGIDEVNIGVINGANVSEGIVGVDVNCVVVVQGRVGKEWRQ
jgi:hypothetical protein